MIFYKDFLYLLESEKTFTTIASDVFINYWRNIKQINFKKSIDNSN